MTIYYDGNGILIRDAEAKDIQRMKDHLRQSDADEVWASYRQTPESALQFSYDVSIVRFTVEHGSDLVAMFGLCPDSLLGRRAQVWMLTTDSIVKVRVRFLKLSKQFIKILQTHYPTIYNFVDARHRLSVKWLQWCGAKMRPAVELGMENEMFHYFQFGEE